MSKLIRDSKITQEFVSRISHKSETDWRFSLNVFLMNFASELAVQLERKNISKSDLALLLGTSRPYITQLLNKKQNLRLETLFKICFAIGLVPEIELRETDIVKTFSSKMKEASSDKISISDTTQIESRIVAGFEHAR